MPPERPWLKTQQQATVTTAVPPKKPVYDLLRDSAKRLPDRRCIYYNGTSLTYGEVNDLSARFASALVSLGVYSKRTWSLSATSTK